MQSATKSVKTAQQDIHERNNNEAVQKFTTRFLGFIQLNVNKKNKTSCMKSFVYIIASLIIATGMIILLSCSNSCSQILLTTDFPLSFKAQYRSIINAAPALRL